jgi:hypothetical protein
MPIFRRPDYTSGITNFIEQLKASAPDLEARQRQGRSIWWEQPVDRTDQQEFAQGRVRQKGYVYQTTGHPNSQ